jgi:hypothetical protein
MAGGTIADRTAWAFLALGAALTAGNAYARPERTWVWALAALLIGGMALALLVVGRRERGGARSEAGDSIRRGVVFAGSMLAASLGLKLAGALGVVARAGLAQRATMVTLGLFLASTGNALPKTLTPLSALRCDAARLQAFQRLAGRAWVLTGLAVALAWLVLPVELANPVSTVAIVGGMLPMGLGLMRVLRTRRREAS